MDQPPLADLLLQSEQTAHPILWHEPWRAAGHARSQHALERRGALAVCAARCWRRRSTAALAAPAGAGGVAGARAAGERLVAALDLRAQPGKDRLSHLLVDGCYRRVCRLDGPGCRAGVAKTPKPHQRLAGPARRA